MTLRIGTCSFTAKGWKGSFYPPDLPAAEMLPWYARHFDTLEIDSSFYGTPAPATVRKWYESTPSEFRFAMKFPRVISHEKFLRDCESELAEFLRSADEFQEKLGPLLLQFPYFRQGTVTRQELRARLEAFLPLLPSGFPFAIEIRNRGWLTPDLLEILERRNIAIALIDHPYMPRPEEFREREPLTADFTYIRLLGDRRAIEEKTLSWGEIIEDRSGELSEWVTVCRRIVRRGVTAHVYVNNHYAGHAPATVRSFLHLWENGA